MKHVYLYLSLCAVTIFQAQNSSAQATPTPTPTATPTVSGAVITYEGVSGSVDKKHRNPALTVGTKSENGNVKILVDAVINHGEYEQYPIRFDFFINRSFLTSQIRSRELPGPIGIDVGQSVAKPPFTYTIVATLLHPNRQFVTVLNDTVYPSTFVSTLDCTFSVADAEGTPTDFSASSITTAQASNDSFSISIADAQTEDGSASASASMTVKVSAQSGSGDLTYTADGSTATVAMSGAVSTSNDTLVSFSLKSADESVSLDCQ